MYLWQLINIVWFFSTFYPTIHARTNDLYDASTFFMLSPVISERFLDSIVAFSVAMVKRRSAAPISSFQAVVRDEGINAVDKSTSLRSLESFGSNDSSACSDDPAMKRIIPKARSVYRHSDHGNAKSQRFDDVEEKREEFRVHFNPTISEVVCEVMSLEDFSEEERRDLFLTTSDMNQIKNDAKFITKYFRLKDSDSVVALDKVYMDAIRRSNTFKTYEDFLCFIQNDDHKLEIVAQSLFPWCRKSKIHGRGLERYCSQKQRVERQAFSSECRAAVVRLSKSEAVSPDDVAKFYHEFSRGNVIYARLMAHADEKHAESSKVVAGEFTRKNAPLKSLVEEQKVPTNSRVGQNAPAIGPEALPFVGFKKTSSQENLQESSTYTQVTLPLDRRKLLLISKQQSSSAKLLARLSNRSLETV